MKKKEIKKNRHADRCKERNKEKRRKRKKNDGNGKQEKEKIIENSHKGKYMNRRLINKQESTIVKKKHKQSKIMKKTRKLTENKNKNICNSIVKTKKYKKTQKYHKKTTKHTRKQ